MTKREAGVMASSLSVIAADLKTAADLVCLHTRDGVMATCNPDGLRSVAKKLTAIRDALLALLGDEPVTLAGEQKVEVEE